MIGLVLRMVVAMAVVIGLMVIAARVLRNRVGTPVRVRKSTAPLIEIISRQPLGRTSSIAIAQVAGKAMILGITENSISSLGEVDQIDLEDGLDVDRTTYLGDEPTTHADQTWKSMLEQVRGVAARS